MILNWLKRRKVSPDQARFDRLGKLLESPIEKRFWAHAYGPLMALGHFTPQKKIKGFRVDFSIIDIPGVPLLNIVIELDGYDYHSSPEQRNHDTARDRVLLKAGWQVVRFTGRQINSDCEGCVRETVDLVREWARWLR